MLQQTTVQAVLPYYRRWLELFPDLMTLAHSPLQKILKAWQGLGYYQRAKNLHLAAKLIIEKFAGRIPDRYEDLSSLPGVGPYTAAAVLSIAYGQPYPVLDANVRRVVMRLAGMKEERSSKNHIILSSRLKSIFQEKIPGIFNQALMEFGALVCKPKSPRCLLCPLADFCLAFQRGEQEIIPQPKNQRCQRIEAVVAVVQEDGKYLIQKRPSSGLLADLWEFPGGKKRPGETLKEALSREIREELSTGIKGCRFLLRVQHAYTQFRVTLYAFECRLERKPKSGKRALRWITLPELRQYPFPSGSAKIIKFLEERGSARSARASIER